MKPHTHTHIRYVYPGPQLEAPHTRYRVLRKKPEQKREGERENEH